MPSSETLERFIARVERNAHGEAIEEFYTINASMQENHLPPRVGRDTLAAHEARALARTSSVHSTCVRPVFFDGDQVVIRWIFRFEWKNGTHATLDELAYQRWQGDKIAQETFFYDPAQFVPKPIGA